MAALSMRTWLSRLSVLSWPITWPGKSTILTAYEHADRDELNRRAQEYLREWGQLDTAASASLPEGRAAHIPAT